MDANIPSSHRTTEETLADLTSRGPREMPSLLTLGVTTFVVVSGEMLPAAVLPLLASDFGVSLGQAGLLVSIWAATVVLASFPLARLTARFERRHVIAGSLAVFAIATAVTAMADSFFLAAVSRIAAAAATGLLWSTVNAHAAAISPEHRLARATAIVLGGAVLGGVFAVPVGHAAASMWGWRAPFMALTLLGLLNAGLVLGILVPKRTAERHQESKMHGRRPLAPVITLGILGGMILAAHFVVFTFVAALLSATGSAAPTPMLLLIFGALSALGVIVVGQTGDRYPNRLVVVVGALVAASLAALIFLGAHPLLDMFIVAAWGATTGAVGPAVQTGIMRLAGAEHRAIAGTLLPVGFNLGIAIGAGIGSATLHVGGVLALPVAAGVLAVLTTIGLSFTTRPRSITPVSPHESEGEIRYERPAR